MSCTMPHKLLLSEEDTSKHHHQHHQHQQQPMMFISSTTNSSSCASSPSFNCQLNTLDNDKSLNESNDNKAFDDVVFELIKVDPEEIASQLTLIDLPLFQKIQPDELISCKWNSRDKVQKAPNIVQFTKRFNQTTFWAQKEILKCTKLETRAKMVTHFIKIAKRLNELQNFNSLMAIIVALKSAPIYRLKKTWTLISKRDLNYFEKISHIMFDTSDNRSRLREMHKDCKLPCIPFLGIYLTDLIHIDIAHPHTGFENPQRRNQMNNICRILSEFQQTTYDKLSDISYVVEYLNSDDYIDELQKFIEDGNYQISLKIEQDSNEFQPSSSSSSNYAPLSQMPQVPLSPAAKHLTSTPINEKILSAQMQPGKATAHKTSPSSSNQSSSNSTSSSNSITAVVMQIQATKSDKYGSLSFSCIPSGQKHRKTLSLANNEITQNGNGVQVNPNGFVPTVKHPLDDSIIEDQTNADYFMKIHDASLLKDVLKNRIEQQQQQHQQPQNTVAQRQRSLTSDTPPCGRNILKNLNGGNDQCDGTALGLNGPHRPPTMPNIGDLAVERLRKFYEDKFWSTLGVEEKRLCVDFHTASDLIFFESAIKRKCIIKNKTKPTFTQWHSYWLQLVGNVMVYYNSKMNLLPHKSTNASSSSSAMNPSSSCNSINSDCFNEYIQSERKHFHKDPSKAHSVANWMVIALFHDEVGSNNNSSASNSSSNSSKSSQFNSSFSHTNTPNHQQHNTTLTNSPAPPSSKPTSCIGVSRKKYDIKIIDLSTGNTYKYRLNNLKLAREWYSMLKFASNLHEHLKPDNLIKFE